MQTDIVLTFTGPDRVGIVEDVTAVLLELEGNVGASRMAHLGGEFAILSLVSLSAAKLARFDEAFAALAAEGYRVIYSETVHAELPVHEGWKPYRIEVRGADHEGIVHEIAAGLAHRGITIESAETNTSAAPITGTPLFSMIAVVLVPPELEDVLWRGDLMEAAGRSNVDIDVTPA
jgi:glycine cleavage system transcriptional repressor